MQADKVHKVLQEVGLMSKDKTNTIPGDTNTNKAKSCNEQANHHIAVENENILVPSVTNEEQVADNIRPDIKGTTGIENPPGKNDKSRTVKK